MFAVAAEAPVDPDRRVETVTLDKGEISRTFQGTLRGREYIDFQIAAGAGQRLGVTLKRGNAMNYFNIMAPGANEALFIGSTSGRQARRMLAQRGIVQPVAGQVADLELRHAAVEVRRRVAVEDVVSGLAIEGITTSGTDEGIVTFAAIKGVVTFATSYSVIKH